MATVILDNIDPGNAWRHQAITWTNVDLSSEGFCGILLKTISQELLKISIQGMSLKNAFLKLFSNLPGANELTSNAEAFPCFDVIKWGG